MRSAITFVCGSFTTETVAVEPGPGEQLTGGEARADHGNGDRREAEPGGGTAVMFVRVAQRSGVLHWLKRMTADAPAAWAFETLSAKLQPPRWISAIAPARKPRSRPGRPGVGHERGSVIVFGLA